MSKELIWLTIPHQLPPTAVWYENKKELIEALNEHELCDDTRHTINDFNELTHELVMKYNSTRIIDWNDYQELRASYKQIKHQRHKVEYEVEQIAEEIRMGETSMKDLVKLTIDYGDGKTETMVVTKESNAYMTMLEYAEQNDYSIAEEPFLTDKGRKTASRLQLIG